MNIYTRYADGSKHEYWYDRSYRTWYAARVNEETGDLYDTIDSYRKVDIETAIDNGHCPKLNEVCYG